MRINQRAISEHKGGKATGSESAIGPERSWRGLRKYLLNFRAGQRFDHGRFVNAEFWSKAEYEGLAYLPPLLADWTAYSRHVFHVQEELQALLELTTIGNLTWGDVDWPYDAFLVTLDRPIVLNEKNSFDCLLVSRREFTRRQRRGNIPSLSMLLLPRELEDFPVMSDGKLRRLERLVDRRRWTTFMREVETIQRRCLACDMKTPITNIPCDPRDRIRDVLDDVEAIGDEVGITINGIAHRIVIGLAMYLTTIPPRSRTLQVGESDIEAPHEVKAITAGAQVCMVLNHHKLTPEERKGLGDPKKGPPQFRELSPHWRRGHFRKPRGQGGDPNAPRTIWVRPALVRADLLQPGTQSAGTRQEVE